MNIHDYANGVLLIHKFQEEVYNRIVEFHINNKPMTFMKTKPFTVEGCKANGNRAVTSEGHNVSVLGYESTGPFPVTARVDFDDHAFTCMSDGRIGINYPNKYDLFLPCKDRIRKWVPEEATGKTVRKKSDGFPVLITAALNSEVRLGLHGSVPWEDLMKDYTQMDGSPCGVEVEE